MDGIGRDAMEISLLAEKALVFDEEPDFAFENVIDLFGLVFVRLGVLARLARCDHQAALIAVSLFNDHTAGAGLAALIALVAFDIFSFGMKRHVIVPPCEKL